MEHLQTWIETFGVVITALATIVLAWVTTVLARETKRLAAIGQSPQIVVTIESSKRAMIWLDMHVENTGTAPAFDIELEFVPPLQLKGRELPLRRISVLKPRQVLSTSLCSYATIKDKQFNVTARWTLVPNGKKHECLTYLFDAKFIEGMSRLGDIPEVEIAKSVKKLSDDFGRVASGYNKLAVNVYTDADRKAEENEREEWLEQVQAESLAEQAAATCPKATDEQPSPIPEAKHIGETGTTAQGS